MKIALVSARNHRRIVAKSSRRFRKIHADHLIKATVREMISAPIRVHDLERTVPEFCVRMGWPRGPETVADNGKSYFGGHAFVAGVLAAYGTIHTLTRQAFGEHVLADRARQAIDQPMGVPAFMRAHPTWAALCRQYGDVPTVAQIVECLSPDEAGPPGHRDRLDSLIGIEARREVFSHADAGTRTPDGFVQ